MHKHFWHHGSSHWATCTDQHTPTNQPSTGGRPCPTLRHGYRDTLRFFGFDDLGCVNLQTWIVEARTFSTFSPVHDQAHRPSSKHGRRGGVVFSFSVNVVVESQSPKDSHPFVHKKDAPRPYQHHCCCC